MKSSSIATTVFMIFTFCGIIPASADSSEADLPEINRRMKSQNGFYEAALLIEQSTAKAAKTPEGFEQYLVAIGNGIKSALEQREVEFSDVLGIGKVANHLDGWARVIPHGMCNYVRFVESVAQSSESARPASIGGKLGCQMQFILFALAIENNNVAKAEAVRGKAISLSKYEGEDGFVKFCLPILDVAFALISKDSSAALSRYREQHKKLADMGLTDMEEILWSTLATMRENGTALKDIDGVMKDLDSRFNKGARIRKVFPDTAAAKAGWRKGDRIVEVDGKTVFYNSDDGGRGHLDAILNWRRNLPNRKPTRFRLKRGETFLTSEISDDSLGIEF